MPESPQTPHFERRARSRFVLGVVLLLVGGVILASNLGFMVPYQWWTYWPWLLVGLGAAQFLWPGSFRARLGGYWLLVVGCWGLINMYHLFGLYWDTSWPIFIIAAGLRVVLGGVFRRS